MPELPDIEYFRKEIDKTIGKTVEDYTIHEQKPVKISRDKLNDMKGHKINSTRRRGKYCFVEIDKFDWLVLHFGMTGFVSFYSEKDEKPEYSVLSLHFKNSDSLSINSKRKLGKIEFCKSPRVYSDKNDIGPDALDLDQEKFLSLLGKKKGSIKTALMDQSLLSGIGNIYSDEILFHSKIFPARSLDEVSEKKRKEVYKNMKEVLRIAIKANADPDKLPENFLIPNRKEGEECPVCSGKIEKTDISGRGCYYCSGCQKE